MRGRISRSSWKRPKRGQLPGGTSDR